MNTYRWKYLTLNFFDVRFSMYLYLYQLTKPNIKIKNYVSLSYSADENWTLGHAEMSKTKYRITRLLITTFR